MLLAFCLLTGAKTHAAEGTPYAWDGGGNGQLGDGSTICKTTPVQVSGFTVGVAIDGGFVHSLALKDM